VRASVRIELLAVECGRSAVKELFAELWAGTHAFVGASVRLFSPVGPRAVSAVDNEFTTGRWRVSKQRDGMAMIC